MSEKVKVGKEVADCIDWFRTENGVEWENNVLLSLAQSELDGHTFPKIEPLLQYSTFEVAQMLINGYEVEKSPEEQLSAIYNDEKAKLYVTQIMQDPAKYANHKSFMRGVETTLEVLGIKIEGINK